MIKTKRFTAQELRPGFILFTHGESDDFKANITSVEFVPSLDSADGLDVLVGYMRTGFHYDPHTPVTVAVDLLRAYELEIGDWIDIGRLAGGESVRIIDLHTFRTGNHAIVEIVFRDPYNNLIQAWRFPADDMFKLTKAAR